MILHRQIDDLTLRDRLCLYFNPVAMETVNVTPPMLCWRFLPTVGFYYMLHESLLIRSPSADMWCACVFIFSAKPHPALPSVGLCGLLPSGLLSPNLIAHQVRAGFTCFASLSSTHAQRRGTRLLWIFYIPLSKPSICEEVGGAGLW